MPRTPVTSRHGHVAVTAKPVNRLPDGVDQLPSGRFRARVADPDGRRVTLGTFDNQTDAGRAVRHARSDVERAEWIDPNKTRVTVDEWFALWMPHRDIRPSTLVKDWERYRLHIKPFLGDVELAHLTAWRVRQWLTTLTENRSDALRGKAWTLLKTALGPKGALADGRYRDLITLAITIPKTQTPAWTLLTPAEFTGLLEEIPARYEALVLAGWYGGMRWSEIIGLQRRDWNPIRGEVTIERAVTYQRGVFYTDRPKNRRTRVIPAHPTLAAALNRQTEGLHPHAPLFTSPQGAALRQPHFTGRVWKPACERAGLTVRFHDLRHSCASLLLEGGASLAQVRDMLGHSSVTVTEIYLHTQRDTLAAAVTRALG